MRDVVIAKDGPIATITLSRPEARNALTKDVLLALPRHFDDASADPATRVVILTGAGGHFCAGADLRRTFADEPDLMDKLDEYLDMYHAVVRAIVRCPKPTIAKLDGCAVGFGADLALACDLRVATPEAYIQEKFVKIGLMPDGGGTFWLPRLLGTARALKALYLADKLDGPTLDELGLLAALCPRAELDARTSALAAELAKGPPMAYARLKASVYAGLGDLEGALARERRGQIELLKSADCLEGIMAWSQKREPVFQGK